MDIFCIDNTRPLLHGLAWTQCPSSGMCRASPDHSSDAEITISETSGEAHSSPLATGPSGGLSPETQTVRPQLNSPKRVMPGFRQEAALSPRTGLSSHRGRGVPQGPGGRQGWVVPGRSKSQIDTADLFSPGPILSRS